LFEENISREQVQVSRLLVAVQMIEIGHTIAPVVFGVGHTVNAGESRQRPFDSKDQRLCRDQLLVRKEGIELAAGICRQGRNADTALKILLKKGWVSGDLRLQNPTNGRDDVVRVGVRHLREDGQRKNPLVGRLCDRAEPPPGSKPFDVIRMQMHGNVMHIDPDALGAERGENRRTILTQFS